MSTTVAAWSRRCLVDVCCDFFSSRLLCFAPAQHSRRKHGGVPCLPLAFSNSTCYYSTCCPTCIVDKDSHPLCEVLVFLLPASAAVDGCQRVGEEQRRSEDEQEIVAYHRLVVRERRCGSAEWCSVQNHLRDHRASCLETRRSRRTSVIPVMVELYDRLSCTTRR